MGPKHLEDLEERVVLNPRDTVLNAIQSNSQNLFGWSFSIHSCGIGSEESGSRKAPEGRREEGKGIDSVGVSAIITLSSFSRWY
jgi:hypothetical protein